MFKTYAGKRVDNDLDLSAVPMVFFGADKFRSEIYAGDLIRWKSGLFGEVVGIAFDSVAHGKCIVTYSKWYDKKNEIGGGLQYSHLTDWNRCEIVGDVFDNPDLIPDGLHGIAGHFTQETE